MADNIHNTHTYDVIIIGGGSAGLTAAVYTSRDMFKTLLIEKNICGGLAASTELIENYPGFPEGISGMDLMARFKEQAQKFGTQIQEFQEVKEVKKSGHNVTVKTDKETYTARALIIASGSLPKLLNVPGEKEFYAKGVSYCATCDGPLYRGKDVAIIGCGNSGLQEGEALLKYVNSVTFVEFLPYMNAAKILQERVKKNEKTKFYLNHKLTAINGDKSVKSITVEDRESGKKKEMEVSGVFIYIGFLPNSRFMEGVVELDRHGYLKTDEKMQTSVSGIYAAGDVRSKDVRQVDVSCGEATIAAVSVGELLSGHKTQ